MTRAGIARAALGVLVAAAVSLLMVEVFLQAGALWVAWTRSAQTTATEAGAPSLSVLAVGDSFTYGMGATYGDQAYPRQLERMLRATTPDAIVTNGGWPGRTSREVLENLPEQLRRHDPDFVYVMVGVNDLWRRPALADLASIQADVSPDGGNAGFRLEWRSGRLLALLRHAWYRRPGMEVSAARTGGERDPAARGSEPDADSSMEAELAPLRPAFAALERGDFEAARAAYGQVAPGFSGLPLLRHAWRYSLHHAYRKAGREEPADRVIDEMRQVAQREGREDRRAVEFLALALLERDVQDAAGFAGTWLERYPTSPPLSWVVACAAVADGRLEDARAALARALEHRDEFPETRFQETVRLLHDELSGMEQAQLRWREATRAFLAGSGADALRRERDLFVRQFGRNQLHRLVDSTDQLGLERSAQSLVKGILLEVADDQLDGIVSVYMEHLRGIAQLARARGARVVFCSYPGSTPPALAHAARRAADETGAGWLDVGAEFERRVPPAERETYFVPDGHSSDRGYALLAEVVAGDLSRRLGRPGD